MKNVGKNKSVAFIILVSVYKYMYFCKAFETNVFYVVILGNGL